MNLLTHFLAFTSGAALTLASCAAWFTACELCGI